MYTSPFGRKSADIKYKYGALAQEYFTDHPYCEKCKEEKLACLNIHHPRGKKVDEFITLCANCHMVEHATNIGSGTYRDEIEWIQSVKKRKEDRCKRDKKIVEMTISGMSLREIARVFNTSRVTILNVNKKYKVSSGRTHRTH